MGVKARSQKIHTVAVYGKTWVLGLRGPMRVEVRNLGAVGAATERRYPTPGVGGTPPFQTLARVDSSGVRPPAQRGLRQAPTRIAKDCPGTARISGPDAGLRPAPAHGPAADQSREACCRRPMAAQISRLHGDPAPATEAIGDRRFFDHAVGGLRQKPRPLDFSAIVVETIVGTLAGAVVNERPLSDLRAGGRQAFGRQVFAPPHGAKDHGRRVACQSQV